MEFQFTHDGNCKRPKKSVSGLSCDARNGSLPTIWLGVKWLSVNQIRESQAHLGSFSFLISVTVTRSPLSLLVAMPSRSTNLSAASNNPTKKSKPDKRKRAADAAAAEAAAPKKVKVDEAPVATTSAVESLTGEDSGLSLIHI